MGHFFQNLPIRQICYNKVMANSANTDSQFFFAFPGPLVSGKILKRYKRFLADVRLADNSVVTAHIANSGSMKTCWQENAGVIMTRQPDSPTRKLIYSLQAIKMPDGWVSVNTMNPNRAVFAAIKAGKIASLCGYELVQTEVKAAIGSRFDLALFNRSKAEKPDNELLLNRSRAHATEYAHRRDKNFPAIVEIKNATLRDVDGVRFPDAVTSRGQKHLEHLVAMKKAGYRSIILFFAGRSNTNWVGPAGDIDPAYAKALAEAIKAGVEAIAIKTEVLPSGLLLCGEIPVYL
jgi:sugar fermentation stimulation protein A